MTGRFLCISIVGLALLGCDRGPAMVPVSGAVFYGGRPLEYGSVMFQPVGREGAKTARSKIAPDGTFALSTNEPGDGVAVGTCHVRITAFAAQKADAAGNKHEELALGKSAIPKRYQNFGTSGIVIDVTPEMNLPIKLELE